MLNTRLVRKQDAILFFEVMAWLVQSYGPPPLPKVPSPLDRSPDLWTLACKDLNARSVFDWAEIQFSRIKSECRMEDDDLVLSPAGDGLNQDQLVSTHKLDALIAGQNLYVSKGFPEVFYDPRDCGEPGYFAARTILQLADIRATKFESENETSPLMTKMITLVSAAYFRQGFTLANLPYDVSTYLTSRHDIRAVPHRLVLNSLCFATCLCLRVRGQSPEQILATYGTRMPIAFRRKVKQACRQIDSHTEALAVLQMLSERDQSAPSDQTSQLRLA